MSLSRRSTASIAAIAVAGTLAGCGGDDQAADGQVELTLWARGNSVPDDVGELLDQQFPDYDITFQDIPDIEDKLRAAVRSQSGLPDVVVMGGNLPSFFTVSDQFLDLADEAGASDAVDWTLEIGQNPDGKQLTLPTDIGPWGLFYNADVLEALGYPTDPAAVAEQVDSWETYRELAEAAAATGQYVCDHPGQVYQARLAQDGYAYFDVQDGEAVNAVDSPISRGAFVESAALAQDGLCTNTEPYTPEWNAAMTQGDIAGFIGPAWEDGILQSAGEQQAGSWRVTTVPGGPAATGGSNVAALAASDHPQEARELAAFIGGPEFQKAGYLDKGLFPASTGVHSDPEVATPQEFYGGQDILSVLAQTAADAPLVYFSPDSGTIAAQFFVALNDLANSGDDPTEVYESLVAENADV